MQPSSIKDSSGSLTALDLSYTYDGQQNITSKIDGTNTAYSLNNLTYDGLDRLTSVSGNWGIGSSAISYDGLGNITRYTSKGRDLDYTYNTSLNRLTAVADSVGGKNFNYANGYDDRGNVTNNGSRSFVFNRANQLTNSGSNYYIYDGYNRRVKTLDSKGSSYSFYSQAGKLLYRNVDGNGVNYIFLGDKLIAKEGMMPVSTASSQQHYHPFGETIEAPKDDVGYTGHKFDTDLGLSYMQQRYFNPVTGRFLSNDPIGYVADNPVMSFNRYMYVNNNPYRYTDPDGEFLFALVLFAPELVALVSAGAFVGSAALAGYAGSEAINTFNESADPDEAKSFNPTEDTVETGSRNRAGEPRVKIKKKDGSEIDMTKDRIKKTEPEPRNPSGGGKPVKFKNPQPGTKGKKRNPTPKEIEFINEHS
jgi:RHS repeat-associated protein